MKPLFKILADSADITEKIKKNLHLLRIRDARGHESDALEMQLTDHRNHIQWPNRNVVLTAFIGFDDPARGKKLFYKGRFVSDEVEHSGPPDIFTIRARGADLLGNSGEKMKVSVVKSWHEPITHIWLCDIIAAIAGKHGLKSKIAPIYCKKKIKHIDQTEESDFHFVQRLAERYDATAKVLDKTLFFMEKGKAQVVSGNLTIQRSSSHRHRHVKKGRTEYTGVRADYYDKKKAERIPVLVGSNKKVRILKKTYPDALQAEDAARSALNNMLRDSATVELEIAKGLPEAMAEMFVTLNGWRDGIDKTWVSTEVEHTLHGTNGLSTRLQLEIPQSDIKVN